jgi:predicted transcriptional regulator
MAAKRKGAGGNLNRSQVVTVRLDPKLKFAAELAAKKQRRTISSFIEWAVEQAVSGIMIHESEDFNDPEQSLMEAAMNIWDVDDADRFVNLALQFPEFLNYEEEKIWKLIKETPYFFGRVERHPDESKQLKWDINAAENIRFKRVREQWELLKKIAEGEETEENLPDIPDDEIIEMYSTKPDVPF